MTTFSPTKAAELARLAREDDERMTQGPWTRTRDNGVHEGKPKQCIGSMYDSEGVVRTRNNLRAIADQLEAACAEVGRLKDLNGRVVPYGIIAATAQNASQPPVHIEPDDSLGGPEQTRFRIVRDEDARRFAEDYKTTARPPYIATVYSRDDADFVSLLYNHGHHLVVRFSQLTADRDRLAAEVERLTRERDEAQRQAKVLRECWEDSQRVGNQRLVELNAVRAHAENVWFWQGDGGDHPESLSCPVVMTADTLRGFVAELAKMRPVYEAALKWHDERLRPFPEGASTINEMLEGEGRAQDVLFTAIRALSSTTTPHEAGTK